MLPFTLELVAGGPIAEQVIFAVKRAVVSGQLRAGDKFPSVRQISQELRINPNTAHRVVAALVEQGVLVATPAVGTVIAEVSKGTREVQAQLLGPDLERFAVESKRLRLTQKQVHSAFDAHWKKLEEK